MGPGLFAGGLAPPLATESSSARSGLRRTEQRAVGFEDYLTRAASAMKPSRTESGRAAAGPAPEVPPEREPEEDRDGDGEAPSTIIEVMAVVEPPPASDQLLPLDPAISAESPQPPEAGVQAAAPTGSRNPAEAGQPLFTLAAGEQVTAALARDDSAAPLGKGTATPSLPAEQTLSTSSNQPDARPEGPRAGGVLSILTEGATSVASLPRGAMTVPSSAEDHLSDGDVGERRTNDVRRSGGANVTNKISEPKQVAVEPASNATSPGKILTQTAAAAEASPTQPASAPSQPSARERKVQRSVEQRREVSGGETRDESPPASKPPTTAGRRPAEVFESIGSSEREAGAARRVRSGAGLTVGASETAASESMSGSERSVAARVSPTGESVSSAGRAASVAMEAPGDKLATMAMKLGEAVAAEVAGPDGPAQAARVVGGSGGGGRYQLAMRLDPPELGSLRLHLQMQGQALTLRVEAETQQVARLIESRMSYLRETLAGYGIQIERTDVVVRSTGPHDAAWQQQNDGSGTGERNAPSGSQSDPSTDGRDRAGADEQGTTGNGDWSKEHPGDTPEAWTQASATGSAMDWEAMTESSLDLVA